MRGDNLVVALDEYEQLKNLCKTLNVTPPSLDEIAAVDAAYEDRNLYISSELESLKKENLEKLLDQTEKVRDRIVWIPSTYEKIKRNLRLLDPVRYKEFVDKILGQLEETKEEFKQKLHDVKLEISSSTSEIVQMNKDYDILEQACDAAQNKIKFYIDQWKTKFKVNEIPVNEKTFENMPTMTPEEFKKDILDTLEMNFKLENEEREKSKKRLVSDATKKAIKNLAKQIYKNLIIYNEKKQEKETMIHDDMEYLRDEIKKCENQKQIDEKIINELIRKDYHLSNIKYVMKNDCEILHQYDEKDMRILINAFLDSVNNELVTKKESGLLENRNIFCNSLISLWFCIQRIDKIKQTFIKYFPKYDL